MEHKVSIFLVKEPQSAPLRISGAHCVSLISWVVVSLILVDLHTEPKRRIVSQLVFESIVLKVAVKEIL